MMQRCTLPAIVVVGILWAVSSLNAHGEETIQADKKPPLPSNEVVIQKLRDEIVELRRQLERQEDQVFQAELGYTKKYYDYLARKAELNLNQFEWQRSASEKLLWLVICVVVSGVVFSGYQLWRASRTSELGGESSIEIEIRKVKVTSSIVGVIVLAISIVFFYFFLIEVYHINVVDLSSGEEKPAITSAQGE